MSEWSEMLEKFCPDGVEYVSVKDCYRRLKGTPITATQMKKIEDPNGEITVYAGGKTKVTARECDIENANITKNTAVLVQSRGIIDFIYCDQPFTFKNEMWAYTADDPITVKFLYYVLKNNTQYFNDIAKKMGSMPQISLHVTEDFLMPFPPLEIQQKIVEMLDQFTGLIELLNKELVLRKKQYAYYRDLLMTPSTSKLIQGACPNGVEYYRIGDICSISRGRVISKDYIKENEGIYPVYSSQTANDGELGFISTYDYDGEYITWTTDGAYAGTVFYRNGKFSITNICGLLKPISANINTKFLYYALSITAKSYVNSSAGNAKLMSNVMSKIKVPIPPLNVQCKIVETLEPFNSLCTDRKKGIQAEIDDRQKQYAYYRDILLTFKDKAA